VREVGFADLDDRLTVDFEATSNVRRSFVHYLASLIGGLQERSHSGYARALATLQDALQVEGSPRVSGIEVFVTEPDSQVFGTTRLDLGTVEDLAPLIRELDSLMEYLRDKGLMNE